MSTSAYNTTVKPFVYKNEDANLNSGFNPEQAIRKSSQIKKAGRIGSLLGGVGMSSYVAANYKDIFVNVVENAARKSIPAKKAILVPSLLSLGSIAIASLVGGLLGKAVGKISANHQEKNN